MDFLDDLQLYNDAMFNAYDFITGRTTLASLEDRLSHEDIDRYPLPFDPYKEDGRTEDIIDIVISHLTTLEDEDHDVYYLPFDPTNEDGRTPAIIDMVIEYYTSIEDYEKCAELVEIKNICSETPIE